MIVTGTGRCGTGFAAKLYHIGHEQVFTPYGPTSFTVSDSSWMAVPYLAYVNQPIIHLIRDPLAIVNSYLGIGFFDDRMRKRHGPYRGFAETHCPAAFKPDDPLERAVTFIIEWSRRISGDIVKLENMDGQPTNKGKPAHLTWDAMPDRLHEFAHRYGY